MNERLFSDEIREREGKRRRRGVLWSVLSFALHLAFFSGVIFLTPVKSLVFEEQEKPSNPAADLSADRIEEISDALSRARINELLEQLEALQAVLHNMDLMKEELQQDYDAFAENSAESVKESMEKMLDQAEKSLADATREAIPVKEKVKNLVEEERKDLTDENRAKNLSESAVSIMTTDGAKVVEAQALAGNALDRVQVQAEFAGYSKTAEAAEKVRDAQIEAATMQNQAQKEVADVALKLSECAWASKDLARTEKAIAEQKEKIAKNESEAADAKKQIADAESKLAEAEKNLADAKNQLADAEKSGDKKSSGNWRAECKKAEKTAHGERDRINREKRRMEHNERRAADEKKWLANNEKRAAERRDQLKEIDQVRRERVNDEQVARLDRAAEAQKQIKDRIDVLRKVLAADQPELQKLSQENRQENELVTRDVLTMKMTDAYELAQELESAITESYKDIKATQMAIERKMSFDAAQKITDVAKSVRMKADREAIESNPRTKDALDRQKVAQVEVVRETDNIVETTVAMMEDAMTIVRPDDPVSAKAKGHSPTTVKWLKEEDFAKREGAEAQAERLAQMNSAADYQLAISEAAAEDESLRSKDLTAVAKAGAAQNSGSNANVPQGGPAAGQSAELQRFAGPPGAPIPGTIDPKMPELVPGNVMRLTGTTGDGVPAKWMYVDSWYVIGPFPNPDRVNLRRKFPPDSVIDLDATYVGKGGRTIKWEYMQARNSNPRETWRAESKSEVVPFTAEEYGIWYAYAEVFTDVACDRWIAVGSDDRSDIWLNGVPVWGSSNKLKQWRVDEGYRRVHLNKGRNKLLVRVENGWRALGWSVCISLDENAVASAK